VTRKNIVPCVLGPLLKVAAGHWWGRAEGIQNFQSWKLTHKGETFGAFHIFAFQKCTPGTLMLPALLLTLERTILFF
jgi:hypothetical protein